MNKALVGIIALLIIGSGVFVLVGSSDDTETTENNVSTQTETAANDTATVTDDTDSEDTVTQKPESINESGSYVEYSDTVLADSSDTKRVLFFHAEWCGVCKNFENQMKAAGVPEGITILETNYDTETALKEQYNVTTQSTFVLLDDAGNAVQTWPFGTGLGGDVQNLYDQVLAS